MEPDIPRYSELRDRAFLKSAGFSEEDSRSIAKYYAFPEGSAVRSYLQALQAGDPRTMKGLYDSAMKEIVDQKYHTLLAGQDRELYDKDYAEATRAGNAHLYGGVRGMYPPMAEAEVARREDQAKVDLEDVRNKMWDLVHPQDTTCRGAYPDPVMDTISRNVEHTRNMRNPAYRAANGDYWRGRGQVDGYHDALKEYNKYNKYKEYSGQEEEEEDGNDNSPGSGEEPAKGPARKDRSRPEASP